MGTVHALRPVDVRPPPEIAPAPNPRFLEQLLDKPPVALSDDVVWVDPYWELQDLHDRAARWFRRAALIAVGLAIAGGLPFLAVNLPRLL